MLQVGVVPTLDKYGYKCTYDRDKEFVISYLEVLILLRRLKLDLLNVRRLMDALTWQRRTRQSGMLPHLAG